MNFHLVFSATTNVTMGSFNPALTKLLVLHPGMFTTESGITCFNYVSVRTAFSSPILLTAKRISSILHDRDIRYHQIKL